MDNIQILAGGCFSRDGIGPAEKTFLGFHNTGNHVEFCYYTPFQRKSK